MRACRFTGGCKHFGPTDTCAKVHEKSLHLANSLAIKKQEQTGQYASKEHQDSLGSKRSLAHYTCQSCPLGAQATAKNNTPRAVRAKATYTKNRMLLHTLASSVSSVSSIYSSFSALPSEATTTVRPESEGGKICIKGRACCCEECLFGRDTKTRPWA